MKKILKDTCILSALMILAVFAASVIWSGITAEIALVLELFLLALIISAVNFVFDEITSLPIIHTYLVKYFGISCIVIVFGSIVGWFYPSNFWMAFIYVGAVLAAAYFLDEIVIRRDIEYINRQISERRDMTDRDR